MIRVIDKCLVITTTKVKPIKGDWMVTLQVGYTNRRTGRVIIPRKRFLKYHDDTPVNRLNAICHGTEKVLFKFGRTK